MCTNSQTVSILSIRKAAAELGLDGTPEVSRVWNVEAPRRTSRRAFTLLSGRAELAQPAEATADRGSRGPMISFTAGIQPPRLHVSG